VRTAAAAAGRDWIGLRRSEETVLKSVDQLPLLGGILGLALLIGAFSALWYREATAHLNQRVQISVANSREPLVGTLVEATADGLILEQPDGTVPISYGRVTAIDRLS